MTGRPHNHAQTTTVRQDDSPEPTQEGQGQREEGVLMPNRYYTGFKQSKISAKGARPGQSVGSMPAMPQKQSYTGNKLPGKAADGFAAMKKGTPEINGYASWNGLSKSSDRYGANTSFRNAARAARQADARLQEFLDQEEAGHNVVNAARRNAANGYKADVESLRESDTAYGKLSSKRRK